MIKPSFKTYELAVQLYRDCRVVKTKAHIKSQLERATLSIVLNLAEGAAKPTNPDKKRFYAMAYGSIRETQALLHILNESGLWAKADKVGAFTYKLIKSVAR